MICLNRSSDLIWSKEVSEKIRGTFWTNIWIWSDLFKQFRSDQKICLNRSLDLIWSFRTDLSLIWSSSGSEICYTPSYNFHRNVFIEVNFDDKICRSDHFDDSFYRSCNFDDLSYRSYNFDDPSCRSSNFDGKICRSFNFDKIFVEVITSIKVVTSIRHIYIYTYNILAV